MDKSDIDYDFISINGHKLERIASISEITEEQASEVVESFNIFMPGEMVEHSCLYKNHVNNSLSYSFTAIESLHSLLKSKGVDDTWINPVIFEVIQ